MGNSHPERTNINLGFNSFDIDFLEATNSHVTLSCSQYLLNVDSSYVMMIVQYLMMILYNVIRIVQYVLMIVPYVMLIVQYVMMII